MKIITLAELGLCTVEEAAAKRGCDPATVRRWASRGEIPCVVVGTGRSAKYLLRVADVDAFTPAPRGRPKGPAKPKAKRK